MAKDKGKFTAIDMSSVKDDAKKSIDYLKKKLPQIPARRNVVIFLGETHLNTTDQEVTQAMLTAPPVAVPGATRVIFERLLDNVYVVGATVTDTRTEKVDVALSRTARSKLIAEMTQDAFENHDRHIIYIPCGSAHSTEIFDHLNRRMATPFTYISKPSCTD